MNETIEAVLTEKYNPKLIHTTLAEPNSHFIAIFDDKHRVSLCFNKKPDGTIEAWATKELFDFERGESIEEVELSLLDKTVNLKIATDIADRLNLAISEEAGVLKLKKE